MKIALFRFTSNPWDTVIQNAFKEALQDNKYFDQIDEIFDYPEKDKFYDIIILCGVRLIPKYNLDSNRIKNQCRYLFDMGDSGRDGRRNIEDMYFYFIPSKPLYPHYKFVPKFINEHYLYPQHEENEPLTVFVDHYQSPSKKEEELSKITIKYVFDQINKAPFPIRVFYQNSKGIEINAKKPEIFDSTLPTPYGRMAQYKIVPFKDIAKFYRKTHIFFPTHRESQGMVAQEIGACGGLTIMQHWMYKHEIQKQFPKLIYFPDYEALLENKKDLNKVAKALFIQNKIFYLEGINWQMIKSLVTKKNMQSNRELVLKNCSFGKFKENLNLHINKFLEYKNI